MEKDPLRFLIAVRLISEYVASPSVRSRKSARYHTLPFVMLLLTKLSLLLRHSDPIVMGQ